MTVQDDEKHNSGVAYLRQQLAETQRDIDALESRRRSLLTNISGLAPFKPRQIITVEKVPGAWAVTNVIASPDGAYWQIHARQLDQRTSKVKPNAVPRIFDYKDGDTHILVSGHIS